MLAAICRQMGGEIRIKGELIDTPGDSTALMKSWDATKQELVLSTSLGTFSEVYRVTPEKQNQQHNVIRPIEREEQRPPANGEAPRTGSTLLDDEKLKDMERTLLKRKIGAMLTEEIRRNKTQTGG